MKFIQEVAARGRDRLAPEDIEPDITLPATMHFIRLYFDIMRWRPEGMSGPGQIGLPVIEAYCRHYGAVLSSVEVDMIRTLDDLLIHLWHKARPSK